MNEIFKVLMHLSTIKQTLVDFEGIVKAAIDRDFSTVEADAAQCAADVKKLLDDGVITIPGVDPTTVDKIIDELVASLQPKA